MHQRDQYATKHLRRMASHSLASRELVRQAPVQPPVVRLNLWGEPQAPVAAKAVVTIESFELSAGGPLVCRLFCFQEGVNAMENRTARLDIRLTQKEKAQVRRIAARCGLSLSEYLRQRALGYAPRELPSEALQALRRELSAFRRDGLSGQSEEAVGKLLNDMRDALILPGRDA